MYSLGHSYRYGLGVAKDDAKAVELYTKAVALGRAQRCDGSLGHSYRYGIGVANDDAKAVEWFIKAAEAGNSLAASAVH